MSNPHPQLMPGADDQPLMLYDWGSDDPESIPIIFFHATSFHARCWDTIIRRLPPNYHAYALDVRGHGLSYKPPDRIVTWQQVGRDIAMIAHALNLRGAIGVGHSMGGNALVRAAAQVPETFAALLLIEPVICPKEWYTVDQYIIDGHYVLRRRREWHSPDEMYISFRGRGAFANWDDSVLRDYCAYALLPVGDGYTLACAPETEVHFYASSRLRQNVDVYEAVAQISVPVQIMRSAKGLAQSVEDLLLSPTAPDLAARFRHGTDIPLADNTHFIPMESPGLVADQIAKVAALIRGG